MSPRYFTLDPRPSTKSYTPCRSNGETSISNCLTACVEKFTENLSHGFLLSSVFSFLPGCSELKIASLLLTKTNLQAHSTKFVKAGIVTSVADMPVTRV